MTPARFNRSLLSRVLIGAWATLAITGAQAESESRPPVAPKTEAASILGAKRDLEVINAVKDARLSPALTGSSPRLALPELRTEAAAVPPPALRAVKPEATGKNWLLDGMAQTARIRRESRDRQPSTGTNRGSSRISPDQDLDGRGSAFGSNSGDGQNATNPLDPLDSQLTRSRGVASAEQAGSSLVPGDESRVPGASNPLTPFLGDWMTPRDYALLRPSLEKASPGGGVGSGDARFSLPGAADFAIESSLNRGIPGGLTTATPIRIDPPPGANPFLESLNRIEIAPPAQVAPSPGLPGVALIPRSAAQSGPAPASAGVSAPVRPSVPDFPKPLHDEKYFKQLKRF